jgi:hypothetical protein
MYLELFLVQWLFIEIIGKYHVTVWIVIGYSNKEVNNGHVQEWLSSRQEFGKNF